MAAAVSPTTSPWASLALGLGKSFPGVSSQPAGGILFAQAERFDFIEPITEAPAGGSH